MRALRDIMKNDIAPSAQTERWSGAGPVRALLGGEYAPAALLRKSGINHYFDSLTASCLLTPESRFSSTSFFRHSSALSFLPQAS